MATDTVHRFGAFGGRYVPETLIPALDELDAAFADASRDPAFQRDLDRLLKEYVGRPSPLSSAPRFSETVGCAVYLKREDLNHTGAHKINNAIGQALLAQRMGKRRIHRRDRGRPAWSRSRNGVCAVWSRLHRLYG